jgi:O-antigen/teichoic acid export membrane protein
MSVSEAARKPGLRRSTARGTLINATFLVAVSSLGVLKGFIVAGFLSRHDYGVWGLLVASLGSITLLKQFGVPDRYVQQREPDQELAFHHAFTLELILNAALAVLFIAAVPILAFAYGRPGLLAPGFTMVLIIPAVALQSPLWIFYRRMEFARQRRLGAIDPVIEFVVTIALAAAGAGYWSLIVGALIGNYAGTIAIVRASPYRLAWRFSREAARRYMDFSWPLLLAGVSGLIFTQGAVIVGTASVGLAGVGAIALASSIVSYTTQVDQIVSQTLYPAICRVRDRADLLFESFATANRLGLMWGVPLGVGIALFIPALVQYGLGAHWRPAIGLIQAFGLIAAVDQIAYNWDDYFRARAQTRPIAVVATITTVVYVAVALPLLATTGLRGFGYGMAAAAVTGVIGRLVYITRLFPALAVTKHVVRAIVPTAPAAAIVLAMRAMIGHETLAAAIGELGAYAIVTTACTVLLERRLLGELLSYLSPGGGRLDSGGGEHDNEHGLAGV